MTEEITLSGNYEGLMPLCESLEVTDKESEAEAGRLFSECDRVIKDAAAKRKSKTDPLRASIDDYMRWEKQVTAPFVNAKKVLNDKICGWRNSESVRIADEERKRNESIAKSKGFHGDIEGAIEHQERAEAIAEFVPKKVETEAGEIRFRKTLVIDSIDIDKLPERYIIRTADQALIKADLKAGMAIIGVTAHEEQALSNYRR